MKTWFVIALGACVPALRAEVGYSNRQSRRGRGQRRGRVRAGRWWAQGGSAGVRRVESCGYDNPQWPRRRRCQVCDVLRVAKNAVRVCAAQRAPDRIARGVFGLRASAPLPLELTELHMRASQPVTEGVTIRFLSEVVEGQANPVTYRPKPQHAWWVRGGGVAGGGVCAIGAVEGANLLSRLFSERSDPNSPVRLGKDRLRFLPLT